MSQQSQDDQLLNQYLDSYFATEAPTSGQVCSQLGTFSAPIDCSTQESSYSQYNNGANDARTESQFVELGSQSSQHSETTQFFIDTANWLGHDRLPGCDMTLSQALSFINDQTLSQSSSVCIIEKTEGSDDISSGQNY